MKMLKVCVVCFSLLFAAGVVHSYDMSSVKTETGFYYPTGTSDLGP